jgi:hypothetical protein
MQNPMLSEGREMLHSQDVDSLNYSRQAPTGICASADTSHIVVLAAENQELRAETERLRADRTRMIETQRRIMELLGCSNPEKIVHDLRNVLNERDLMKSLVDDM